MPPLSVTFSDLEGHFWCLKPFCITYLGKYSMLSTICFHMNRKVHMACNFFLKMNKFPRSQPVMYTVMWYYLGNGAR